MNLQNALYILAIVGVALAAYFAIEMEVISLGSDTEVSSEVMVKDPVAVDEAMVAKDEMESMEAEMMDDASTSTQATSSEEQAASSSEEMSDDEMGADDLVSETETAI